MTGLMDHLDYTGVLTIEFFLRDGDLLFNEFAPRVHNSGHWTIDGAECSQFENHLRAISGLPLGATAHDQPLVDVQLDRRHAAAGATPWKSRACIGMTTANRLGRGAKSGMPR